MNPVDSISYADEWKRFHSRPTREKDVWEKVQDILSRRPLQQADMDKIKELEETIIPTHQHPECIIFKLVKKAAKEGNLDYYVYAHQLADTMGIRSRTFHTFIENFKEKNKLIKI
ncbi:MAG: hypothetical protein LLG04_07385 [Parachlamydia sp.]|nr:hypothetical protein [Parachlamydia sp.]